MLDASLYLSTSGHQPIFFGVNKRSFVAASTIVFSIWLISVMMHSFTPNKIPFRETR